MISVGYGFTSLGPGGEVPPPSEWDGWRRLKASKMDDIVDETWASWALPRRVSFGDSGGPALFNPHPLSGPLDLQLVAVASDVGTDCVSKDYRARVDTSAAQRWIAGTVRAFVANSAVQKQVVQKL